MSIGRITILKNRVRKIVKKLRFRGVGNAVVVMMFK